MFPFPIPAFFSPSLPVFSREPVFYSCWMSQAHCGAQSNGSRLLCVSPCPTRPLQACTSLSAEGWSFLDNSPRSPGHCPFEPSMRISLGSALCHPVGLQGIPTHCRMRSPFLRLEFKVLNSSLARHPVLYPELSFLSSLCNGLNS